MLYLKNKIIKSARSLPKFIYIENFFCSISVWHSRIGIFYFYFSDGKLTQKKFLTDHFSALPVLELCINCIRFSLTRSFRKTRKIVTFKKVLLYWNNVSWLLAVQLTFNLLAFLRTASLIASWVPVLSCKILVHFLKRNCTKKSDYPDKISLWFSSEPHAIFFSPINALRWCWSKIKRLDWKLWDASAKINCLQHSCLWKNGKIAISKIVLYFKRPVVTSSISSRDIRIPTASGNKNWTNFGFVFFGPFWRKKRVLRALFLFWGLQNSMPYQFMYQCSRFVSERDKYSPC